MKRAILLLALITQLVACFFLALPLAVFAGGEIPEIFELMRQSPSIENRKALASQLLLHWERIDKGIPRLSPDEYKWLIKEMEAGRKVGNRKEYAQNKALSHVGRLILALKAIQKPDNIKEETGRWVLVYRELSDRDLYVYLSGLVKLGVVSPPPHTAITANLDETEFSYSFVTRHILDKIILGYFFGGVNSPSK